VCVCVCVFESVKVSVVVCVNGREKESVVPLSLSHIIIVCDEEFVSECV
jgi:hypothetical protein